MKVSVRDDFQYWAAQSSTLLIKKLSRNDCQWADSRISHQNGFYVPREIRDAGYFPTLVDDNPEKPHIYHAALRTLWPESGEIKDSHIRHFSNKGQEMHLTVVPKQEFARLTPASLLVGGKLREPVGGAFHWFTVFDSSSEEAELVETLFELNADFHFGLFDPARVLSSLSDEDDMLIDEIETAISNGALEDFIAHAAQLPAPDVFASAAQDAYQKEQGLKNLNPFEITCPGDAIMRISRDIEYALYKRAELRHRAAEVVRIIKTSGKNLVTAAVKGFPELDASFLSASQHRKSRAGRSFEKHISRLLRDGGIDFEEQVMTGGRRPDFILPSLRLYKAGAKEPNDALILSAKTTLRERWKQVTHEKLHGQLYLATVDDRISAEAISEMEKQEIILVVPESLKGSSETDYGEKDEGKSKKKGTKKAKYHGNVITFSEFFRDEIGHKRPSLRRASLGLLI